MRRITLLALLALTLLPAWGSTGVAHSDTGDVDDPAVVTVYGADGEPFTERMLDSLDRSGTPYVYKAHDENRGELQAALRSAGVARCCKKSCAYKLPVVAVDDRLLLAPRPSVVRSAYDSI